MSFRSPKKKIQQSVEKSKELKSEGVDMLDFKLYLEKATGP